MRSFKKAIKHITVFSVVVLAAVSSSFADEPKASLLTVGSKAPDIDVEHWISDNDAAFEHTTTLGSGKVYVVEFWATWCGPCIRSMPHLVELQAEYSDTVQIISVSNEDLDTVQEFLEGKVRGKEDQTYAELTKTYCLTTDPDESVKKDYFRAAGRSGIPCAFIVGKTGVIEWIGHPLKMDEPLKKVVNDNWDRDKHAAEVKQEEAQKLLAIKKQANARKVDQELAKAGQKILKSGDYQKLYDYASGKLEDKTYEGNRSRLANFKIFAMLMGDIDGAQETLDQFVKEYSGDVRKSKSVLVAVLRAHKERAVDAEILKSGLESAAAMAAAEPTNPSNLYMHARFLQANDNLEKAIEVAESAVKNSGPRNGLFVKFLEQLQKEQKAATP